MNFEGQGELLLVEQREKHSWRGKSLTKRMEGVMSTKRQAEATILVRAGQLGGNCNKKIWGP